MRIAVKQRIVLSRVMETIKKQSVCFTEPDCTRTIGIRITKPAISRSVISGTEIGIYCSIFTGKYRAVETVAPPLWLSYQVWPLYRPSRKHRSRVNYRRGVKGCSSAWQGFYWPFRILREQKKRREKNSAVYRLRIKGYKNSARLTVLKFLAPSP